MNPDEFAAWLRGLQSSILAAFETFDAPFRRDPWERNGDAGLGGRGLTAVLDGGRVLERAGVAFSDVVGKSLPPSATERNPHLAGRPFRAMGVSLVVHPRNPFAPTSHMNVRLFRTLDGAAWWFGGGFDLTPIYPFDEDIRHWHRVAKAACDPSGAHVYPALKRKADEYFYLKHRGETRGVGGLFADDLRDEGEVGGDAAWCEALIRRIGTSYLDAILPILERRRDQPYGEDHRRFQALRRGRYVEFNLVFDRGTLFGLQSGGRTESILLSMPPTASWAYDVQYPEGSPEAGLRDYLRPRDWA